MVINFYKYYKEIKNRFVIILFTWTFCLNICYFYKEVILFSLINLNHSFIELNTKPYFIFTEVTEIFNVYLELTLFITNQISILFLFYQIFMFLSFGLYKFEFLKLNFAFKIFLTSWLFCMVLLYNLVIPVSWNFFLGFQKSSSSIQPFSFFFETKLTEYFYYFTNIYYICLICCQFLGILTIILTSLNERFKHMKTVRKLFYLMFVIFSTIVTPPDIISQIFISLSLIMTYEFLLLTKFVKINMAAS